MYKNSTWDGVVKVICWEGCRIDPALFKIWINFVLCLFLLILFTHSLMTFSIQNVIKGKAQGALSFFRGLMLVVIQAHFVLKLIRRKTLIVKRSFFDVFKSKKVQFFLVGFLPRSIFVDLLALR